MKRITNQQYANSRLIIKLLPVVDELEMALNHSEENESNGSWVDGIRLIHRKVAQLLESEGLDKIESVGQPFDPLQHEAVGTAESGEVEAGYIVEVLRNGYKLRERIIQPAQVVVAR
jgi:molecular chaperone GrpE